MSHDDGALYTVVNGTKRIFGSATKPMPQIRKISADSYSSSGYSQSAPNGQFSANGMVRWRAKKGSLSEISEVSTNHNTRDNEKCAML